MSLDMLEILFFYCSFIAKILNLESYTYIEYDQKICVIF
jgi:hypothetical protein